MNEIDPEQRKFCPGCGVGLHVSAPACPHCGAPQPNARLASLPQRSFPHGWHILATVLSGGVWLIPYILIWGFRDKNRYL